ncbi:hypothetical protein DsansV1_C05g0055131 [Dioscorea sansibarensis]
MDQSHRKKSHVLLIAYPLQGHIIPSVHLATKLASNGFTVTFVNTESIHHQTSKAHKNNNNNNTNNIFTGPVTCISADTFFVWPSTISKKFGIPYILFWTEPALVYSLYYHMHLLRLHGHFGSCGNYLCNPSFFFPILCFLN